MRVEACAVPILLSLEELKVFVPEDFDQRLLPHDFIILSQAMFSSRKNYYDQSYTQLGYYHDSLEMDWDELSTAI